MAMADLCEYCGTIFLEGEPIVRNCAKCPPLDESKPWYGWRLLSTWILAIAGAWAVFGVFIYSIAWVLQ